MIYSCPYCETSLNLQPEHIGREIACPSCGKSFIADDLPPVTIATRKEPEKSRSNNTDKVVVCAILAIILISFMGWIVIELFTMKTSVSQLEEKVDSVAKKVDEKIKREAREKKNENDSAQTLRELDADASNIGNIESTNKNVKEKKHKHTYDQREFERKASQTLKELDEEASNIEN